jgi:hypothetical protein
MNAPTLDPKAFWQSLEADEQTRKGSAMRQFRVIVGPKNSPRLSFTAMARSSTEAFMRHFDLAAVGERVVVLAEGARS